MTTSEQDIPQKSLEHCFADWENATFGFGYGTGEPFTLELLHRFFDAIGRDDSPPPDAYDYRILESELSPYIAWLMINLFCHGDLIEYGTSPRFGWLTEKGRTLRDFVQNRTVEQLYDIVQEHRGTECDQSYCNCGPGFVDGRICPNPFFNKLWQKPDTDAENTC